MARRDAAVRPSDFLTSQEKGLAHFFVVGRGTGILPVLPAIRHGRDAHATHNAPSHFSGSIANFRSRSGSLPCCCARMEQGVREAGRAAASHRAEGQWRGEEFEVQIVVAIVVAIVVEWIIVAIIVDNDYDNDGRTTTIMTMIGTTMGERRPL